MHTVEVHLVSISLRFNRPGTSNFSSSSLSFPLIGYRTVSILNLFHPFSFCHTLIRACPHTHTAICLLSTKCHSHSLTALLAPVIRPKTHARSWLSRCWTSSSLLLTTATSSSSSSRSRRFWASVFCQSETYNTIVRILLL